MLLHVGGPTALHVATVGGPRILLFVTTGGPTGGPRVLLTAATGGPTILDTTSGVPWLEWS